MSLKVEILNALNTPTEIAFPIQDWSSKTWSDLPSLSQDQILREAQLLSKPASSIVHKQVVRHLSTQKIHRIACFVLSCFTWPFHVHLPKPPRSFREFVYLPMAYGYFWKQVKESCARIQKWLGLSTYHVAALIVAYFGLCVLARWLEQWSGITSSIELAQKEYRNLTAEVQDCPVHLLTTQRASQVGQLALALTDIDSKAVCDQFPMLVGPPGTGKTSAILNLVYQVEKLNQHPKLRDKTFYSVNAAQWAFQKTALIEGARDSDFSEFGQQLISTEPLLEFLKIIEGKEHNTVVFFDEAHCLGDACVELLKTCMVERRLKVIFATTEKQYEEKFANNLAFVDRLKKIEFPTLSDKETEEVLEHLFFDEMSYLEVEKEALSKVVQLGHELYPKRANPRLSIQLTQQVMKTIQNWAPTVQRDALQKLKIENLTLQHRCRQQILMGRSAQEGTHTNNTQISTLQTKVETIDRLYHAIKKLQQQLGNEQQQLSQMADRIVQQSDAISRQLQMQYRITKYVINVLQEQIQEKATQFQQQAEEEYPLKITQARVTTILGPVPTAS